MKGIIAGAVLGLGLISQSHAEVLIDVRNDTSEDCSLAVNARIDKTKWITQGWYVFASGEEAPIILKDINDKSTIISGCGNILLKNIEVSNTNQIIMSKNNIFIYDNNSNLIKINYN